MDTYFGFGRKSAAPAPPGGGVGVAVIFRFGIEIAVRRVPAAARSTVAFAPTPGRMTPTSSTSPDFFTT